MDAALIGVPFEWDPIYKIFIDFYENPTRSGSLLSKMKPSDLKSVSRSPCLRGLTFPVILHFRDGERTSTVMAFRTGTPKLGLGTVSHLNPIVAPVMEGFVGHSAKKSRKVSALGVWCGVYGLGLEKIHVRWCEALGAHLTSRSVSNAQSLERETPKPRNTKPF